MQKQTTATDRQHANPRRDLNHNRNRNLRSLRASPRNLNEVRSRDDTKEQRSNRDSTGLARGARELRGQSRGQQGGDVEARGRGVGADRDAGARGHVAGRAVGVLHGLGDGGVLCGGALDRGGGRGLAGRGAVPSSILAYKIRTV
jgi:hypothetical protein